MNKTTPVAEYDVVEEREYKTFIEQVNQNIRVGGWQPWGNLNVLVRKWKLADGVFDKTQVYVQAMVRYRIDAD